MDGQTRFNCGHSLCGFVLLAGLFLAVAGCGSPGESGGAATATAPTAVTATKATPTPPPPAVAPTSTRPPATLTPPPTATPIPPATPTAMTEPTATMGDDGPLLIYSVPDGHLYRGSVETGLGRRLTTGTNTPSDIPGYAPPRVSPDGQLLALNGNWGGATAIDLTTGEVIGRGRGRGMHQPSWSPDGRRLAYISLQGHLCVYYLDNAPADCIFQQAGLQDALWSPTAEVIAAAVLDPWPEEPTTLRTGQVWLVDARSGEASAVAAYLTGFESVSGEVLAWAPDGRSLVIRKTPDGGGAIYRMDSGALLPLAEPVESVSPDSRLVLHPSGAVNGTDGELRFTLPTPNCPGFLSPIHAWSPDGARLAVAWSCFTADGDAGPAAPLNVVDTATGATLWQQSLAPDVWPVAWSPDGQYILLNGPTARSSLWRLHADGTDEPELIIEDAYLLAVVESW